MTSISFSAAGTATLPTKAYAGDAGYDLPVTGWHAIRPGEVIDLPTGLRVAIPEGYYGRIVGRSSTRRRRGIEVVEGIIDAGYRGELFVCAVNRNDRAVLVSAGERLAQLIPVAIPDLPTVQSADLPESDRGSNGFGSSGGHRDSLIYLGFPIDQVSDPDRPHREWSEAGGPPVYCPHCVQGADPLPPGPAIDRNMAALDAADHAVFVLPPGDLRSFGVPVEMYRMLSRLPDGVVVVGTPPPGIFTRWAIQQGLLCYESVADAVSRWRPRDA